MRVPQALPQSLLHRLKHRAPLSAAVLCVALGATGCSLFSSKKDAPVVVDAAKGAQVSSITQFQKFMWFFSPYRPDIQQGNFISQEMLAQLKPGMTRDQVKFILGTPLMADIFHADRWDYPFRLAKGNGELITSTVVIHFKDNVVERFEGGNLPTEKEYIALIAGPAKQFKKDEKNANLAPVTKSPLPAGADTSAAEPVQVTPEIGTKR